MACGACRVAHCFSVIDLSQLLEVYDASTVHRLATDRVIRRGEKYHQSGLVDITSLNATEVIADVQGTRRYEVRLDASGSPDWSCTCPAAVDGDFCKHCVAVAVELAMIDAGEAEAPLVLPPDAQPNRMSSARSTTLASGQRRTERDRLVDFVEQLPPSRLVALVIEQTETDWKLHTRLLLEADQHNDEPVDLDAWVSRINTAMDVDDYIDWRDADAWASNIYLLIDALGELLSDGRANSVVSLAEHAFRTVERVVGSVDDSNSGCLREISERLGDLHFRACELARPDPISLARSLVDLELNSDLEGLYHAVGAYVDLLGDDGLAEYGRLLDSLGDGNNHSDRGYSLKSMRRAYVETLDDVDVLIAELAKDPSPRNVVETMTALAGADRMDEAITSGRDGLALFRSQRYSTSNIVDTLASLLKQSGDVTGAIRLYQDAFEDSPSLTTLQRLLDAVEHDRDQWRDAAIEEVQQRVAAPQSGQSSVQNDVLVEILMWAKRHDDAWDAAHARGCNPRRWMDLAATRESKHPIDAIDVYEPQVLRSIEAKNNQAYAAAIQLMSRIRRLAESAGVPERFDALVVIARTAHKPKRNLQKLLNEQGW